jgi:phospholipid-translocating ATPase
VEGLESNLDIIGATGIEDRLQEDVPQTLSRLQQAEIRVMMITGDKLETAENIGYLSQLIREDYRVYRLSADIDDVVRYCEYIRNQTIDGLPFTLVIEGRQIA